MQTSKSCQYISAYPRRKNNVPVGSFGGTHGRMVSNRCLEDYYFVLLQEMKLDEFYFIFFIYRTIASTLTNQDT